MFNNSREKDSSRYSVKAPMGKKALYSPKEHLFKVLGFNSLSRLLIYWEFEHDKGKQQIRHLNNIVTLNTSGNRKCFSAQALTGIAFTAKILIELSIECCCMRPSFESPSY